MGDVCPNLPSQLLIRTAVCYIVTSSTLIPARMYNCWLPAASIAVSWVNPDWVARLFFHSDNSPVHGQWFPTAETATVQLWDPAYDDGTRHNFSVSLYQKSLTEDYPNGNWWHSALTQGFSQMGMLPIPDWTDETYRVYGIHHENGSFWHNNGIPAVAMAMLTGRPVKVATMDEIPGGVDEWWGYIQHANESPVVVTTVGVNNTVKTVPEIHGNHAYAVLTTMEEPVGNRTVLMRNPWGTQDWYKAEDVWTNSFYLNHLVNFTRLEWAE